MCMLTVAPQLSAAVLNIASHITVTCHFAAALVSPQHCSLGKLLQHLEVTCYIGATCYS